MSVDAVAVGLTVAAAPAITLYWVLFTFKARPWWRNSVGRAHFGLVGEPRHRLPSQQRDGHGRFRAMRAFGELLRQQDPAVALPRLLELVRSVWTFY